jgi:Mg/Co/Ni transporter MgtE
MGQPQIGLTVGVSLFCIAIIAATTGADLPFLFNALGFDPALMSAPCISTVVDIADFTRLKYISKIPPSPLIKGGKG